MIRFIHAADIHLDSQMKGVGADDSGIDASAFRLSTRHALRNLVDWAIAERVDFVTLGGDNFDGDWKDYKTGLYFNGQMARLYAAGIPVVSISGNHDAANMMTRSLRYPDSFRMLDTNAPETFEPVDGVRVVGQGFRTKAVTENLVAGYPENDSASGIVIGLLHTSLAGVPRDAHDNYAPCELADLRRKRFHFWGLGHIHQAGWMEAPGDTPVLYPGNLQGRHIRETGPKGAWLIELNDDGTMAGNRFEPLDTARWELLTVDITGLDHEDDCRGVVAAEIARAAATAGDRLLAVRMRFTGLSQVHLALRRMHERSDEALLADCRNEAARNYPGRVWIEAVELKSTAPTSVRASSDSMLVLQEFVGGTASGDAWITDFLDSVEIRKVRKQVDFFDNDDENAELKALFDPETLREMIREVPEVLESRLESAPTADDED